MSNYTVNEIRLTEWTKARQQHPRTRGMRHNDHIKYILGCASLGLSVISLILLFYGAYLFDNGLTTKLDIFITCSVPLIISIACMIKGALLK